MLLLVLFLVGLGLAIYIYISFSSRDSETSKARALNGLPRDADGDAMRRVFMNGSDPSKEMTIDFHLSIPDEETGKVLAPIVFDSGFRPEIWEDTDGGRWTLQCSKEMLLTYEAVINAQRALDGMATQHKSFIDGWGTLGNKDE